jgi:hypothetical protein
MRDANQGMDTRTYRIALMASLLFAACGGSDKEKQEVAKLAENCSINSNCETPLVCAFAHCHEECAADRDCRKEERCVKGKDGHVCQLSADTTCERDKECLGDQVCGVDKECRDPCDTVDDCSGGQICAKSGECASKDPTKDTVDEEGNILTEEVTGGTGGSAGKGGAGGVGGAAGGGGRGGSGGMAGSAGRGGSGGVSSDPCGPETQPNEDRDHALPLELNTDVKLCLQNSADLDFYELKTPATPAQGGFYVVKVTEVGTSGGLRIIAQAAADNGDVQQNNGSSGMSVFLWFNAKAGATFRLHTLSYTGGTSAVPYTLRVDYTGVPDDNEPNDVRGAATALEPNTPIQGYLFAGYENSTSVAAAAWEDWFKVHLPGGTAQIAVTDMASDIGARVELFDSLGVSKDSNYGQAGVSVVWTPPVADTPAGDYLIKISQYTGGVTNDYGSTIPAYLTQPYTLKVTTPSP